MEARARRPNEKAGQDPFERANHVSKSISEAKFYIQAFKGIVWLSEVVRRKLSVKASLKFRGTTESSRGPKKGTKHC